MLSWSDIEILIKSNTCVLKKNNYDCILAVSRGGLVPAVMISHFIGISEVQVISIKRNSTNEAYSKKIEPIISNFDKTVLAGKNVLIVEDIVSTGHSLSILLEFLSTVNYKNIDVFSLVQHESNNLNVYSGMKTKKWIKFPWEK